jgi:TonB-linked outer membrane protein, SusC/RagA family
MKFKYTYVLILLTFAWHLPQAQVGIKVQGTVSDFLTSKRIAQTNISVKGKAAISTESTAKGTFSIEVPSPYSVLIVSFPGYQAKEIPLDGKNDISIRIVPEGIDVGESTVRLPYGTFNQRNLNGAYTVIAPGPDKTIQYRNIFQMLEGKVPGFEINAYSGVPGEGSKISLGGARSLYTTNDPLIVIDGLPVNNLVFDQSVVRGNIYNYLSDINVKDIESITVLRDAAAAGIYGSRAANGVIVITTKGGTDGKTFLDVSIQQGISLRNRELPVMNANEYLPYLSEKINRQGIDQQTRDLQFPFFTNTNTTTAAYWSYANNTDWQKVVSRNAVSQNYFVNLRGGDATSKYSFNVGFNDADGIGRGINSSDFTSRFNLEFKISPKFSAGTYIGFSRTIKSLMDQGYEERVNPLYLGLVKSPITSPFQKSDEGVDRQFFAQPAFDRLSNPLAVVSGVSNDITNYWLLGNIYAQYDFSGSLRSRIRIGLDRRGLQEDRFTPSNGVVPVNYDLRYNRTSEEQIVNQRYLTVEHTLTFEKQLNSDNRIVALGGYNFEIARFNSNYGYSIGSPSDDFKGLGDGRRLTTKGINEKYNNRSAFANVDYTFREKLLVKGGVRMEQSSKFGDKAQAPFKINDVPVAVLPYAGVTYRIKSESGITSHSIIDAFNVHASWGLTANQDIPANARYSLYESKFYTIRPGIVPSTIGNDAIKWETDHTYDGGLDLSLFHKLLGIRLDYFNTKTTDLLVPRAIDGTNGTNYYWYNGGSIQNNRIELGLNSLIHVGKLLWKIDFNISKNKNEVLSLPNGRPIIDGAYGYTSIAIPGKPAGLFYGYKGLGVFSTDAEAAASGLITDKGVPYRAGDFHFEDLKPDGIINESDKQVIGDPNPDFYGGISSGLTYKNFDLDAVFSFSYGNDVMNVLRSKLETGAGYENQSIVVLNRWVSSGDRTNIPNTQYNDVAGNRRESSFYVEDGSYFKMRSLTLTYNIKKRIGFIRNADVYVSGYNLFTISKYLGWDPEVAIGQTIFTRGYDFGNYPLSKMFMIGARIGL